MTVISAEPLDMAALVLVTGKDALATIGGYRCRIMNYSKGQELEVETVVSSNGYRWGLKRLPYENGRYTHIAFVCE